ncbi:hypothetical protein M422DRAFT_185989 [Sphaerobolus stellatus SS14]|uniref:Uncharacterized protein n=1 Tax=Sphaerobolus stellatus (strain SS14) TaxID=990650 RepID=A0A0C9UA28_SPHS4|nr:hypothetical protein M422DRAFT_266918 [Sphaerobolus stellatus SS14]KIJ31390.1 hypothetical protein M422DRAFT_185989 [Sphaerobolus stellatus SS14]
MANLIRSAKSGSDWTKNELFAFNIAVVNQDVATFFGDPNLPASTIDPIILNNLDPPPGPVAKSTRLFFRYLKDAMERFPQGALTESAVDSFAAYLLGLLDYDEPDRVVHQRLEIGFVMCGSRVDAKPDVCVMDENYLLLVQEDKRRASVDDPESQLIAEAIAAFYENNRRRSAIGLPAIQAKVFAGITMFGTAPTFYKLPITTALLDSIMTAQFPLRQTIVHKLVPPVPNMAQFLENGMRPLENRRVILQCFEAFKQFVE